MHASAYFFNYTMGQIVFQQWKTKGKIPGNSEAGRLNCYNTEKNADQAGNCIT